MPKHFNAVVRRLYSLRVNPARASAAAAARPPPPPPAPPPNQIVQALQPCPARRRRGRPKRQIAGVKNIEGRIRNKHFKTKTLLPQSKNIEVRKRGVVVCRMVVRRQTIFPGEVGRA